jgi:hypothetical protein
MFTQKEQISADTNTDILRIYNSEITDIINGCYRAKLIYFDYLKIICSKKNGLLAGCPRLKGQMIF